MSFSSNPKCPWCDHEEKDWQELISCSHDGDTEEVECSSCDKKYEISMHISYDFSSKAVGCEKHELVPEYYLMEKKLHQYKCRLCKSCFYDWQLPDGEHPKLKDGQFVLIREESK